MEIKNISLVLALLLLPILFSGCAEKEEIPPTNDMTPTEEVSPPVNDLTSVEKEAIPITSDDLTSAEEESSIEEEVSSKMVILYADDVLPAEMELIIDSGNFYEEIFAETPRYEKKSDSYENALTVIIDGNEYAPMYDSFGYHSVAELKEALLDYYTDEYIDSTSFFNQSSAAQNNVPVYYRDFNGELYKWDMGDYFYESAFYIWNSEVSFRTISRNADTAIIELCMYVKPMYTGNMWCTRYFTIEAGRISAVEHIKDDEPSVDDFDGNWAGYDKNGKFVNGYSFSSDPEEDYGWGESGAAVEYYADGTFVNYDSHTYEYGSIMLGNVSDSNWLQVKTYSHNGLHEFTASKLKFEGDAKVPTPILIYKRVNNISIEEGKVVIK